MGTHSLFRRIQYSFSVHRALSREPLYNYRCILLSRFHLTKGASHAEKKHLPAPLLPCHRRGVPLRNACGIRGLKQRSCLHRRRCTQDSGIPRRRRPCRTPTGCRSLSCGNSTTDKAPRCNDWKYGHKGARAWCYSLPQRTGSVQSLCRQPPFSPPEPDHSRADHARYTLPYRLRLQAVYGIHTDAACRSRKT